MNSYKAAAFALLLLLVTGLGLSSPVMAADAPTVAKQSLLWKVSGKGIKTSYVFGTFHLVPKDQFSLPSKVKQKLIKSETVVFEVDLDSPELTRGMTHAMRMAKPLESLMTPQDYNWLAQFVHDSLERNMQFFRYIKPGFLGQMLLYPKMLGYNPESYDLALLDLAKKWHKSVYTLETPAEQIALFDQINLETQTQQFLNSVKQFDRQRKLMKQMLTLYHQEDLNGLYALINSESGPDNQDFLLDERNERWLNPLIKKMKKSPSFIAVGAAHLPGEYGLLEMLKAKGYKVEPVFD
ncbi:TraB/GumN family protein [Rufibacter sp. DG15C]|uniref:TraB/GumN family protein n=1 Tax=Rufibacter sp. DG15C TaxID=1379909 RepID=UPI0009EA4465|nr:TraB/GumN family protein [Rufibacter sp. DG15C]